MEYAIVNGSANYIQDGSEIVPLNANAIDIDDIDYPADNNYDESVIQPKTYSKRTLSMWVYWHMGLISIIFCLMGSVLIYAMDNKVLTNDSDDIIYQIYFKLFMTKWIANSVFSFTFFYPTRYCKYINPLQPSIPLPHVSICSFGMFIIISVEIYFFIYFFGINPVSYDINYLNVIICEFGAIFGWCYIIIYRFVSKRENLNFAFVGDEQTEKTSLYTLYREKLYPDKYHKNCCWKVVYYLYQSAVFIYNMIEYISVIAFVLVFSVIILVAIIYVFIDLYFISILLICCCNKRRNRKLLNMKRYGPFFDYILYNVVLNEFKVDRFFAYFIQNEPFKHKLLAIIVIMFQWRFVSFLKGNSLPNYDLIHDKITTYSVISRQSAILYTRWLPSIPSKISSLPSIELIAKKLFLREKFVPEKAMNLSLFSATYIRYFIHQFCNTHSTKWNFANNPIGINLCQLYRYNINMNETEQKDDNRLYKNGLFKSMWKNNEEFPLVKEKENGAKYFASALDGSASGPFFACIHILYFRNHQYTARSLKKAYPKYSDYQIFEIAKMVNILVNIKAILSLYGDIGIVQSAQPSVISFDNLETIFNSILYRLVGPINKLFPSNSTNIPIEFNILYRWHQLIPPQIILNNNSDNILTLPYPNEVDLIINNENSLETLLISASKTHVGKLSLMNTEPFLVNTAVINTLKKTRYYNLASFNDYREEFGFKRYDTMDELTSDPVLIDRLNEMYNGNVDNVEYYIGIFAEDKIGNALHGSFLTSIFATTVISLLTSSPLFRKDWNTLLTPVGKQIVDDFNVLEDLIKMHTRLRKSDVSRRVTNEKKSNTSEMYV